MIKLLRVDHRLLHGQVAFSWTSHLSADCILLASDSPRRTSAADVRQDCRPAGNQLVVKNIADSIQAIQSGVTDQYKLFIVLRITIAERDCKNRRSRPFGQDQPGPRYEVRTG